MANTVKVKRPDGKVLTVSRKHFERSLKGKGYTEVKDAPKKPAARKDEGK